MSQPLKNPPPSQAENDALVQFIKDGIHADCKPYQAPPGSAFYENMLPETQSMVDPFQFEGCTPDLLLADHLYVLHAFGIPDQVATPRNNAILTNCYDVSHHDPEQTIIRKWSEGVPLPPYTSYVPPPLFATFSQAMIEQYANENPPRKYNGDLAYSAADAHIWEPQVQASLVSMATDSNWNTVFDAHTRWLLAQNMAGKGLPYAVDANGNINVLAYLTPSGGRQTAAQVLRQFDKTTLPGVPATP